MLRKLLELLPLKILSVISRLHIPRYSELIETVYLNKFLTQTDFAKLDAEKYPVCSIEQAEYAYPLVNVCFVENMLKNIVWGIAHGFRPVVNFKHPQDGTNLWEELFEQPFAADSVSAGGVKSRYKTAPICFPAIPDAKDIAVIGKLYNRFVRPNRKFKKYFEDEYRQLIAGKRVLGVLCRGTDYVKTKPAGHPVQPPVKDVISLAKSKMEELHCEAIYLATEEKTILLQFEQVFPGRIITNKRQYFDSYHTIQNDNAKTLISAVHFDRENDHYYKSLEYFSSLFLLSRCTAFIAGSCGGSRAAAYLNAGKYEYMHFFDLGVY